MEWNQKARPLCFRLVATALLVVTLAGCEEDVASISEGSTPFSLYGYLNPGADTQYVRVFAVSNELERDTPASLDAEFQSLDLVAGTSQSWRDSLVFYRDSTYGHVFWAPFRAVHDHAYRLDVSRSDGQATWVEVEVPPKLTPIQQDPVIRYDPLNRPLFVLDPLLLEGRTPPLQSIETEYWVKHALGSESTERVVIPYDDRAVATSDGWLIDVDLTRDYPLVRDELHRRDLWTPSSTYGIYILLVTVRAKVVNPDWSFPGADLTPDLLIEPGTMSNVENGFGFVGSGYRVGRSWRPVDSLITATEFVRCPCGELWCEYHPACS